MEPALLRQEAARCRRLASALLDDYARKALLEMATEREAQAAEFEAADQARSDARSRGRE